MKIGLWYGGAASSFIPVFSVYIVLFDKFFKDFLFFGSLVDIKAISIGKNQRFRLDKRAGESLCTENRLQVLICDQNNESRHSIKKILFTRQTSLWGMKKV